MALNINNINNQDLNKEIITPEGKSSSIKDQVAEQLNAKKAKDNTETVTPETEKPQLAQNILVNAETKAKKAHKKAVKATEKAEKANKKADDEISKAEKAIEKAASAAFIAEGKRQADEQKRKNNERAKYGFTRKADGSWTVDIAIKAIDNSLFIDTIADKADNVIKVYELAKELAKETGNEAIIDDTTKQLKDYYDKQVFDKSAKKNAIKKDVEDISNKVKEKNPELYNALWGSAVTDVADNISNADKANDKTKNDKKASAVTPEPVAEAIQESKAEKTEKTEKTEEAKPEQKDALSTVNRARSIILEGNETAEQIRTLAKKQITLDTDRTNEKLEQKENAAKLRDFLPHFAISRYLNNEFGNIKKDKYGNPLNPEEKKQADRTLAYFILDKIGAGLINSSNIMNGLAPSQKTALQKYNETQMDNALKRDDSVRAKIYTEQLNNIVKDDDTFRQLGITNVAFVDNALSRALEQNIDNVNKTQALKILKEQAAFLNTLPEKEKNLMVQAIMLQTTGDNAMKILGKQWQLEIMKNNKAAEADIAKADYDVANYGALKLYANNTAKVNYNKLEQEYENLKAQGKLTNAQVNNILTQVQLHQKEIDWYNANETLRQISGYTDIATSALNSASGFINALKPW